MYQEQKTERAEKKAYRELEIYFQELDICDVIRTSMPDINTEESDNDQRGEWDPL